MIPPAKRGGHGREVNVREFFAASSPSSGVSSLTRCLRGRPPSPRPAPGSSQSSSAMSCNASRSRRSVTIGVSLETSSATRDPPRRLSVWQRSASCSDD
jgi:hypothetical protein